MRIVKEDIQRVVGPLQMCVGNENGVEVASLVMQAVLKRITQKLFYLFMLTMHSTLRTGK